MCKGGEGIETLKGLSTQDMTTATICTFSAAFTVTVMTILKIPVSTSQAVVGAIIGIGMLRNDLHLEKLGKVVLCWIGTPIGGALLSVIFYYLFRMIFKHMRIKALNFDVLMRIGLIGCGCYGAYALGANNVANVAGVFVGKGMMGSTNAALLGGVSIAFGALTYSHKVMMTVGKGIVKLDVFSSFICVLSHAVTVHVYAFVGVPVSTSQAIVGAVIGISFVKGLHTVNYSTLGKVWGGWIATPFVAAFISSFAYFVSHLKYTG